MAIVVEEKYKGRRVDGTSAEVIYLVFGTDADKGNVSDADAFSAVVNSAPETWNGLPVANVDVREELVQGTIWLVAVTYSATDPVIYTQPTTEYEFSYQAPSERVYQSLATRGIYTAAGAIPTDTFFNAINVTSKDGKREIEGLDLPAGSPTSTWIYTAPHGSLPSTYEGDVEAVMGDVSSVPFMGRPALTMRFVSCQGGARFSIGTTAKWYIRFGFQFARNRDNFTIQGINVAFKGGHDLLWAYYEGGEFNDDLTTWIPKPKAICIEQVFFETNLPSILGIG